MDKMSEFDPSKVECREAVVQDFQEIMDINREIYSNFDYLPTMHFIFAHSSQFHPVVAVYNGKIVAYKCFTFMEDRKVIFNMAGRTHPSFVKKGIQQLLTSFIALKYNTESCYMRYTLRNANTALSPMALTQTWTIRAFKVDLEDIKSKMYLLYENNNLNLSCFPSLEQIHIVLENEESVCYLKKTNRYLIAGEWFAYETNPKNIKQLAKMYPNCFTFNHTTQIIEAFTTYCCVRNLDGGLRCDFYYSGKPDFTLFKSHMGNCLAHFFKITKDETQFRLVFNFPDDVAADKVDSFLKPVFGDEFVSGDYNYVYGAVMESSKL